MLHYSLSLEASTMLSLDLSTELSTQYNLVSIRKSCRPSDVLSPYSLYKLSHHPTLMLSLLPSNLLSRNPLFMLNLKLDMVINA